MIDFKIKIRIFFGVVFCLIIVFIGLAVIVPSGEISYVFNFDNKSKFISKLSPNDRIKKIEDGVANINSAPIYFTLNTLRKFEKAELSLKYKTTDGIEIIEAGILADDVLWQYNLKSIENKIVDRLSEDWHYSNGGDLILLQRNKNFENSFDFLNNPPSTEKIALYNYDLKANFILDDYVKATTTRVLAQVLRGDYQFFTYIKDEDLYFDFTISDLNENKDKDDVEVVLYYEDVEIGRRILEDDGITADIKMKKDSRNLTLDFKNMPEGAYKISFKAGSDIITEKIKTKQSKISFLNKVTLAKRENGDRYNGSVFTDSKKIFLKTEHPDRLQQFLIKEIFDSKSFYSDGIDLNKTYKQFSSNEIKSSMAEIIFEKEGFIIAGDGVFSFDYDSYINPRFKKVDVNLDIERGMVDYVLASYRPPYEIDGWMIGKANFDLGGAYSEDGKYSFIISVPGLDNLKNDGNYLEIDEIKIKLTGTNLFDKIKKIIKK